MENSVLPNNLKFTELKEKPFFFVIGRPRSGTTLLRTLLDAHSNVNMPVESQLILGLATKYSEIKDWNTEIQENFFNDLIKQSEFDTWSLDQELLRANLKFIDTDTNYQTMIKYVYSHFVSVFDKEDIHIIGDKNPHYALRINKIFSLFPDAKYLHITRDYRDNILSNLKFEFASSRKYLLAYRWKESIIKISKLKEKYPNQFLTIKYEDLVEDPALIMKTVCDFLEIEFQSEILRFHEKEAEVLANIPSNLLEKKDKYQSNLFRPINKSAVGKWKQDLSENDIMLADMIVGDIAEKSGYERKYTTYNIRIYLQYFLYIFSYKVKQVLRRLIRKYLGF